MSKFLYQPVSPFKVTQFFGDDKVCISLLDNKTLIGKENHETCPSGFKSVYSFTKGHNGLDIIAKRWRPIYASHSGTVTEVETEAARGLGVGIVSDEFRLFTETQNYERYKTRYWHLIAIDVHKGDKVKVGDLIGYADSTGYSTGDHLHFELKPVKVINIETFQYSNVLQSNGKLGAIDPLSYMENIFALDIKPLLGRIAELMAKISTILADKLRGR